MLHTLGELAPKKAGDAKPLIQGGGRADTAQLGSLQASIHLGLSWLFGLFFIASVYFLVAGKGTSVTTGYTFGTTSFDPTTQTSQFHVALTGDSSNAPSEVVVPLYCALGCVAHALASWAYVQYTDLWTPDGSVRVLVSASVVPLVVIQLALTVHMVDIEKITMVGFLALAGVVADGVAASLVQGGHKRLLVWLLYTVSTGFWLVVWVVLWTNAGWEEANAEDTGIQSITFTAFVIVYVLCALNRLYLALFVWKYPSKLVSLRALELSQNFVPFVVGLFLSLITFTA